MHTVTLTGSIPGGRHGELRLTRSGVDVDLDGTAIPEAIEIAEIAADDAITTSIWPTGRGVLGAATYRAEWRPKGSDGWYLLGDRLRVPDVAIVSLSDLLVGAVAAEAAGLPAIYTVSAEAFFGMAQPRPDGLYLIERVSS
ncbi:MAG: hypothetical protein Q4G49_16400 [Paracoccus sp. (in: a-proteobacteria)]|nr:hypothetical protein [Paracoccus sp. (in: a-proteobacteria)]